MKRHSPIHLLAVGAVLLLSSTRLVSAVESVVSPAAVPTPLVERPSYFSPIIGAPVPDFVLPDMAHKPWKLSEHIGKNPVFILIVSSQPRPADENDTPNSITAVLRKQALRLKAQNMDFVVATQGIVPHKAVENTAPKGSSTSDASGGGHLISQQDRELLHLLRDDGSLAKAYGALPQCVVGVLIDRYGILREINFWPFGSKALDAALQNVDATTPIVEVGKLAPDFALFDSSGQMRRLSDLRGKHNVMLTFFPEGSTCGCGSQLPSIDNDLPMLYANNTQIWLLSSDNAQAQNDLIETFHSSIPFIPDVNKKVARLFQATIEPTEETQGMSILIDVDGVVRCIDKVPGKLYSQEIIQKITELKTPLTSH